MFSGSLTERSSTALVKRKPKVTQVIVNCDCGFGNALTIRGSGGGLNWDKGESLRNLRADEWLWETKVPFDAIEYKILVNDTCYEVGDNHAIAWGRTEVITPNFG